MIELANMFAALAKKATTLSEIMEGRDKISTEDIIKNYQDGITINAFDMITTTNDYGEPSTFPVLTFAEDDTKFLYGGKALNDICQMWLSNFDGDIETCSKALKSAGGVKIKLATARTKAGKNFTSVEVIG